MFSPWIESLRSVALTVPDLNAARTFYTQVWRLEVVERAASPKGDVLYLRGSGRDHHLLSLHEAVGFPQILKITLRARSATALQAVCDAAVEAGGVVERTRFGSNEPSGGECVVIRDSDGSRFEIVHGDAMRVPTEPAPKDQPMRLAHAVINSDNIPKSQRFLECALGFVLSDRTRIMAFMNCNADHHSLALGDTDNNALNHIAFVMPTLDAVMRGGGRMKDAGHAIEWGPGRHGPGDNAFNYFIDPFGIVIEYTAEVEQIDKEYKVGSPTDWTWPTGRVDQWGIGAPPSAELKAAQRRVLFAENLPT